VIAVLDASAAIELLLRRGGAAAIIGVLGEADHVAVPDLYIAEVANAIWKLETAAGEKTHGRDLLRDAVALPDEIIPSIDLVNEAYGFSVKHGHPVYDSLYAIAARRNGATLLTMDRRLAALATSEGLPVVPVAKQ
jgi:predicted nucleic acid-binding protein